MKDTRLILAFTLVATAVPWNSRRERVSGASKQQLENEKKGKCRQQEIHRLHERLEKLHTNHKEELLEARNKLTEKEDKIRQLKKAKDQFSAGYCSSFMPMTHRTTFGMALRWPYLLTTLNYMEFLTLQARLFFYNKTSMAPQVEYGLEHDLQCVQM